MENQNLKQSNIVNNKFKPKTNWKKAAFVGLAAGLFVAGVATKIIATKAGYLNNLLYTYLRNSEAIGVATGKHVFSDKKDTLYTEGISSCCGLAITIINKKRNSRYLRHAASKNESSEIVNSITSNFSRAEGPECLEDLADLKITVVYNTSSNSTAAQNVREALRQRNLEKRAKWKKGSKVVIYKGHTYVW